MPYGHAESNDLLRNRERSTRARETLRYGVFATRKATQRSYDFFLELCEINNEIIRNSGIYQTDEF